MEEGRGISTRELVRWEEVGAGQAEQARELCQQTLLEKTLGCVEEEAGPGAREAAGSSGKVGPGGVLGGGVETGPTCL